MESLSYGFHESPFRRIINQRGFVFTYKCILKRYIDDLLYDVNYILTQEKMFRSINQDALRNIVE